MLTMCDYIVPFKTGKNRLLIVADEVGLCELSWVNGHRRRWTPQTDILQRCCSQLDEYFAGRRTEFDVALSIENQSDFQQRIMLKLCEIPYGKTWTYGQLGTRLNVTGGARAVGQACATNPLSIVVPCHRVIGSDDSLTGYGGGQDLKRKLLALEQPDLASAADNP